MVHQRALTSEALEGLTKGIEPWLSCDDCFHQVDVVVDNLVTRGIPIREEFLAHFSSCRSCREEARTLVELAALDYAVDPTPLLAQFDEGVAPV